MKTSFVPQPAPVWLMIDAEGQTIGKIAARAATLLRGKHRTTFAAHMLCADHVVIINASKIALPPKKGLRKTYFRHTGFPGNMKVASLTWMLDKKPTFVIEHAVKGMLTDNRLRQQMLKRLHVFADSDHTFAAQQPKAISISTTSK
jgi:large subunit ribosomal protein L13